MNVKVKKLNANAKMPTCGSKYAAGYDLYACLEEPVTVQPHETAKIGTGLSFQIPEGYFGAIFARSGMATKRSLAPANKVGVCDSDYRGEYIVALHNDSEEPQTIEPFERIAQLIVMPYLQVEFEETDELTDAERGAGGFGSTGEKQEKKRMNHTREAGPLGVSEEKEE